MSGSRDFQVDELILPGLAASDGLQVAQAFHRELGRLWEIDRAAGMAWRSELGALSLELDPQLIGDGLGKAIACEVRARAINRGNGS